MGNGLLEFVLLEKILIYGSFKNKEDAIKARKDAEEKYFKPILDKYNKNEAD